MSTTTARSRSSAASTESAKALIRRIQEITAVPEVGRIYEGEVRTIKDFGAFVQILPGTDGMVHISELANERVKKVTDVVKEGDMIKVKVIEIDNRGRIRLSRKAALAEGEEVIGQLPCLIAMEPVAVQYGAGFFVKSGT